MDLILKCKQKYARIDNGFGIELKGGYSKKMYIKWLEDFVNDNIKHMTEEQISHFKECAIRLSGNDNLIEAFDKYSYNDFIQL